MIARVNGDGAWEAFRAQLRAAANVFFEKRGMRGSISQDEIRQSFFTRAKARRQVRAASCEFSQVQKIKIGMRLRASRGEAGWAGPNYLGLTRKFCKTFKLDPVELHNTEAGRSANLEFLGRAAAALGLREDWLVKGTGTKRLRPAGTKGKDGAKK